MTPEELLKQEGIYLGSLTIGGVECAVGYIKKFRFRWMATQLNTFVFIGQTHDKIDRTKIDSFSIMCFNYATANNKGWPRGLQSGIGSVAILMGNDIDPSAVAFCQNPVRKHWSAFEIPVLFDTEKRMGIRYTSKPLWGAIYFSYFTSLIDKLTGGLR